MKEELQNGFTRKGAKKWKERPNIKIRKNAEIDFDKTEVLKVILEQNKEEFRGVDIKKISSPSKHLFVIEGQKNHQEQHLLRFKQEGDKYSPKLGFIEPKALNQSEEFKGDLIMNLQEIILQHPERFRGLENFNISKEGDTYTITANNERAKISDTLEISVEKQGGNYKVASIDKIAKGNFQDSSLQSKADAERKPKVARSSMKAGVVESSDFKQKTPKPGLLQKLRAKANKGFKL